ncbi:MAG: ABC transporter ATP-binding protein [Ruminococcus sp.]|nr:ABC transporter ATP-binding protein [Ruminococcus sp.]
MKKIELNNISVSYITGDFATAGLKDIIIQKLKGTYVKKEFLALQGITFSLEQGELLGIVGTNGAGKSTLCKVISGIMRPTAGTMSVKGSIASLLELGTGFDPDLTVKENAFLRGALLGYTREFMNNTYEDIIEFAELKEFEDRKFSHLSSGMKSRLAFSIACLVNPEILILDEVLSVGDGAFRKKSEEKMLEVIQGGATTILVSHSLAQIRRMATKVLWIEKGKQIDFGETEEICDKYEEYLNNRDAKKRK